MAQYSYNGWLASANPKDFGGLQALVVRTESFAPGVRAGDVWEVLSYVATQIDARVEKVDKGHSADDWGFNFRANMNNVNQISCHGSGTAFDYNAVLHPNGVRGTWTADQKAEIAKILAEVDNVVANLPYDEMHFEICDDAAAVKRVADILRARKAAPKPPVAPKPVVETHPATIRKGSQGPAVRELQKRLKTVYPAYAKNLVADGDFGPATEKVVMEFQRRRGLTVDGVVGPATWDALGF